VALFFNRPLSDANGLKTELELRISTSYVGRYTPLK
jgi:hypothetical protein